MTERPAISASPRMSASGSQLGRRKIAAGAAVGFWIWTAWLITSSLPSPTLPSPRGGGELIGSVIRGSWAALARRDAAASPQGPPTGPKGEVPGAGTRLNGE